MVCVLLCMDPSGLIQNKWNGMDESFIGLSGLLDTGGRASPLGRPHPVSYPVSYLHHLLGQLGIWLGCERNSAEILGRR